MILDNDAYFMPRPNNGLLPARWPPEFFWPTKPHRQDTINKTKCSHSLHYIL